MAVINQIQLTVQFYEQGKRKKFNYSMYSAGIVRIHFGTLLFIYFGQETNVCTSTFNIKG